MVKEGGRERERLQGSMMEGKVGARMRYPGAATERVTFRPLLVRLLEVSFRTCEGCVLRAGLLTRWGRLASCQPE